MHTIEIKTKLVPVNQRLSYHRGRNILSPRYRDAKKSVEGEVMVQRPQELLVDDVELNILFFFGDNRRRDIDSYLKIVLDAMEGYVYTNDSQVAALHVYKQVDKENPRTIVQIV